MRDARAVVALGGAQRLHALLDTGLTAAPDPTFDRFADMVCLALDAPVALVSLVEADRQFFPGAAGLRPPWEQRRETPLGYTYCQRVVATAGPVVIVDVNEASDLGVGSYAGMPLVDGDGVVLGSLCAIDHRAREWTQRELTLLGGVAAAVSDVLRLRIESHRTAANATPETRGGQLRIAYDRSQLLLNASVALLEAQTIGDVLAATHQMVNRTFDPVNIGMVLLDDRGDLRVATSDPLPSDIIDRWLTIPVSAEVPAAQVFRTGEFMGLPDPEAIAEAFPSGAQDLRRLGWQAIACSPIPGSLGNLGALTLAWSQPHEISLPERAMIASIARYTGRAIDRVKRFDRHSTTAAILQKALLTPLPTVAHLSMAVRYLPAHHEDSVGGDWYDAVALPGERLALVIGDACGHSLQAAAAMSELRSMLRGFLVDRAEPPSALLRRLEHASRALAADTIATVLIAYLDPAPDGSHLLTWSNAGHPPPIVVDPEGGVTRLSGTDPLIGATRHAARTIRTHLVPAGATIVLHTDGLVESRSETIDAGFARLDRMLADHHTATPAELADHLVQHAEELGHEDDVALLIVSTLRP